MGQELDSEMLQRLQSHYGEMSDGELLAVAARPEDLTDMAAEVMRGEMTRRNLRLEEDAPAVEGDGVYSVPGARFVEGGPPGVGKDMVALMTFHDAMQTGEVCDALEAEGIVVDVRDVADKSTGGGSFYGGPPVALQVIVKAADQNRAVRILREKMGLFPLQEVEEADPVVDDGTVGVVGTFGRREDADGVAQILDDARIWHRITANPEGSVESEDAWTLEVREVDLVRAGDAVEKAMG